MTNKWHEEFTELQKELDFVFLSWGLVFPALRRLKSPRIVMLRLEVVSQPLQTIYWPLFLSLVVGCPKAASCVCRNLFKLSIGLYSLAW